MTPGRNPGNVVRPLPANRYRPRVWTDIQRLQRSNSLIMRKLPFAQVVRKVAHDDHLRNFRWEVKAVEAVQEACEAYITSFVAEFYLILYSSRKNRAALNVPRMTLIHCIQILKALLGSWLRKDRVNKQPKKPTYNLRKRKDGVDKYPKKPRYNLRKRMKTH